ncbi:hypothetical protein MPTA7396_6300 [Mycoplasmoides pneumoniae]|nr:hypothetical protein KPI25BX_2160 [Mycoplasmoides pneumoniae]GLL58889.1 hypothetical protein Y12242BV_2130 [Mycoplasmoides pneumoniae]GLL59654.1 hypothetical protein Y12382J_2600 [Mycoplasmoides pneumoniae]
MQSHRLTILIQIAKELNHYSPVYLVNKEALKPSMINWIKDLFRYNGTVHQYYFEFHYTGGFYFV